MPIIVGVKFENNCKVYSFDPGDVSFEAGDKVIVDTQKGNELGEVVKGNTVVADADCPKELKKVVRRATDRDLDLAKKAKESEPRALTIATEKAVALGLKLKFVKAEVSFDCKRVALYFTADERVDFRDLVKDGEGLEEIVYVYDVSATGLTLSNDMKSEHILCYTP